MAILSEFHTPPQETVSVTGSIITTDPLDPKLKRSQGSVRIIDRDRLKEDCKNHKIDWPEVLDKVLPPKDFIPSVSISGPEDFKKVFDDIFKEDSP